MVLVGGGFEEAATERHGFEPSAVRARIKAREAVVEIADGRLTVARAERRSSGLDVAQALPARPTADAARSTHRSQGRNDPLAS